MIKITNEEWEIPSQPKVVRRSYSVNASACVSMLNKYYDIKKDGKIVDTVILKEPYTVIGSHEPSGSLLTVAALIDTPCG